MKTIFTISVWVVLPSFFFGSHAQSSFTLSLPLIYSKLEMPNNWSPSTAINRQNQFNGSTVGTGITLVYSFRPTFIIKDKHISMNVGVGYFKQGFDIQRPFDYVSPAKPIFYTDYYSDHCLSWSLGVSYKYSLGANYFLTGNITYGLLSSFRQDYTPTYSVVGTGYFTQTNYNRIDFGNMLMLAIGINRNISDCLSLGFNVIAPVYSRWRNDKIFKDDPSTSYGPKFSLGSSLSIAYLLKQKTSYSKN